MYFEKIDGAKNPANMLTKCVDVGILRLQSLNWYSAAKMFMIV